MAIIFVICDQILHKYPFDGDQVVSDRYYYQSLISMHKGQMEDAEKFLVEARNLRVALLSMHSCENRYSVAII